MKNLQLILCKRPDDNFPNDISILQEKELDLPNFETLPDGYIVTKNLYLSIDPAMWMWMSGAKTYLPALNLGNVMHCFGVGIVVFSNNTDYHIGDEIYSNTGIQLYSVIDSTKTFVLFKIPKELNVQPKYYLNQYGNNGMTAFIGLIKQCKPQKGETVVISTAAGATGLICVKLCQHIGARVVGITGSEEKCRYLLDEVKIDEVINYKTENMQKALKQKCPNGIDVYYDNVGEDTLDAVLLNMNDFGRIAIAGAMSAYNDPKKRNGVKNFPLIIQKRLRIRGFLAFEALLKQDQMVAYMLPLGQQGKIDIFEEYIYDFKDIMSGIQKLFNGKNIGKILVNLQDSPIYRNYFLKSNL